MGGKWRARLFIAVLLLEPLGSSDMWTLESPSACWEQDPPSPPPCLSWTDFNHFDHSSVECDVLLDPEGNRKKHFYSLAMLIYINEAKLQHLLIAAYAHNILTWFQANRGVLPLSPRLPTRRTRKSPATLAKVHLRLFESARRLFLPVSLWGEVPKQHFEAGSR